MPQKSIFEILAERGSSYNRRPYTLSDDPGDDFGDRIEEEYNERFGVINDHEKQIAWNYFSSDYMRCQNSAVRYLNRAKGFDIEGHDYRQCIRRAWNLTIRAAKDMHRAKRICSPEKTFVLPEQTYERIHNALVSFRQKLYFVMEFPEIGDKIYNYYEQMKDKIEEEDYEAAGEIKRTIEKIVAHQNEDFRERMEKECRQP